MLCPILILLALTPFDTVKPDQVILKYATLINDSTIKVEWKSVLAKDVKKYLVYGKSASAASFATIDTTDLDTFYTIKFAKKVAEPYCIEASAMDSCANNMGQVSKAHCINYLTAKALGCTQNIRLKWTGYSGFSAGISKYNIYRKDNLSAEKLIGTASAGTDTFIDGSLNFNLSYTYRIEAVDKSGSGYSSFSNTATDKTFKPETPAIKFASKISTSGTVGQIVIKWKKQNTLPSRYIKTHDLYYRKSGSATWITLQAAIPVSTDSFLQSGLDTRNSDYEYLILANDSCGNKSDSSVFHKTIELKMTVGQLIHNLSWTAYKGWPVKEYYLQRLINSKWTTVDSANGSATTKMVFPAPCNKVVHYRVLATDSFGDIAMSDTAGGQAIDSIPTNAPNILNASVSSGSTVKLSFLGSDSSDTYQYAIMRSTNNSAFATIATMPFTTGGVTYNFTDFISTTTDYHRYVVVALDSCLNATPSDTFATIQLQGTAGNLENQLRWRPFKGYPIDSYIVTVLQGGTYIKLASVPAIDTSYLHQNLNCNVARNYIVYAHEKGGSLLSFSDSIILTPYDTVTPPAPVIEIASVTTDKKIYLSWTEKYSVVKNFDIYIRTSKGTSTYVGRYAKYNLTLSVPNTQDSTYFIKIAGIDSCSGKSSPFSLESSPVQLSGKGQELSNLLTWSAYKGFPSISKYYIYKYKKGWNLLDSVSGTTLSYTDKPLQCNVAQTYRIGTLDGSGKFLSFSDSLIVTPFDTVPSAPPVINYASVKSGSSVYVEWNTTDPDVKKYELSYKSSGGSWTVAGTTLLKTNLIVTGLNTLDSTYSFRVVAIDSCGANRSKPANPHTVIQLKGTALNLGAQLDWSAYQGWSSISKYYVYKYNGGWNLLDSVSGAALSYTEKNLKCNIPELYRVNGRDNTGKFITLSDSVKITPFDTATPPGVVLNYATVQGKYYIHLDWQKGSAKVKQYEIQYKTSGGSWMKPAVVTSLNYTITGLNTVDSSYCVRVLAVDSCSGKRSIMNQIHCVIQLDGKPKNLSNLLTWTSYSGWTGNKQHLIYKWIGGKWAKYDSVSSSSTSYTDINQPCNVAQFYHIETKDITGAFTTSSDSISLTPFDTIKPAPVQLNYATVLRNGNIKVSYKWNTKTDLKYFEIWRSDNGGSFAKVGTVQYDSQYVDKSVSPSTNAYAYYIIAVDSCSTLNRSLPSDTDKVMQVSAKTGGCKPFITLNWNPYLQLPGVVDNYYIFRSKDLGTYQMIASVAGASSSTFKDTNVIETSSYCYRIEAYDVQSGFGSFSDSICMTPYIFPRPKAIETISASVQSTGTAGSNTISWTKRQKGDTFATGYRIYHSTNRYSGYTLLYQETDTNKLSYTQNGVNNLSSDNYYYVTTNNVCKVEALPLDTHKVMRLKVSNGNLQTKLDWNTYIGFKVSGYTVLRNEGFGYKVIASVPATDSTYMDTNIRCNIVYSYKIKANESGGFVASSLSDTQSIVGKDTVPPTSAKIRRASVEATDQTSGVIEVTFKSAYEANRAGYKVYRRTLPASGTFVQIKTVMDTNKTDITYTDTKVDTKSNVYSYYIVTFDSCGNSGMASDTHTVIYMSSQAQNAKNVISWSNYIGWKNWTYRLERRVGSGPWLNLGDFASSVNTFDDKNVHCHILYQYRITGFENGTSNFAYSNTDTSTAFENNKPEVAVIKSATVTATGLSSGKVVVSFARSQSGDVAKYILYRSLDGITFTSVGNVAYTDSSIVDQFLNTYRKEYYYRVATVDSCGNMNVNTNDVHKTIQLTAIPGNQEIDLTFKYYSGAIISRYDIFKNDTLLLSLNPITGETASSFVDTNIICKRFYTYQVKALFSDGTYGSVSNRDSTIAIDNKPPRPVHLITATVIDPNKKVRIDWRKSSNFDAAFYVLYRKKQPYGVYEQIYQSATASDTSYIDSSGIDGSQMCYSIRVVDFCNNASPSSNEGCIMVPIGKADHLTHAISWNDYTRWGQGVETYNVYKKEDNGDWTLLATLPGTEHSYLDENLTNFVKDHCYQIEAIERNGYKATSKSMKVCLVQAPIAYMPNAFTPGMSYDLNDKFGPVGTYFNRYDMKIYDRWGELMYMTQDGKPWDGTFNGSLVEMGVYIYQITIYGFEDSVIRFNGTFQLLH